MRSRAGRALRASVPLVLLLVFALACVGGGTRQVQESVNRTKVDYEAWLRQVRSLPAGTVGMPLIIEPGDGSTFDSETLEVSGWSVTAADRSEDPDAVAKVRIYLMPDGFRTASAETARPFSEGTAVVDEETGEWKLSIPAGRMYAGATYIAARTEITGVGSSGLTRISVNLRDGRPSDDTVYREPERQYALDSGFRPGVDDYSFRNGIDTNRADDWEVWKLVFGGGPLEWTNYHIVRQGVFESGMCFGFAASASTVWEGDNDVSGFPGEADTLFGVRMGGVHQVGGSSTDYGRATPRVTREFFQRYFVSQYLSGFSGRIRRGTQPTLEYLESVLSGPRGEAPVLVIREKPGGSGHAITPFAISRPAEGQAVIWVWDNNHPGQARPVYVDTTSWSWSYDLVREGEREGRPARTWSSELGWMGYVPTSEIVELMERTPGGAGIVAEEPRTWVEWLLSPFTMVTIAADPLFEDEEGARFGVSGEEVYEEIEGIDYHYPDIWVEPTTRLYFHGEDAGYARTATLAEAGEYAYVVSDATGIARAEVSGGAGTDVLDVDANGGALEYAPGAGRDAVDLTLFRPVGEAVRAMGTEGTSLEDGDTFAVVAIAEDTGIEVVNGGAGARSYVPVFGADDEALFVGEEQVIEAGDTHAITADDWDDLTASGVTLTIDRGSDGDPDEVVVLQDGEGGGGDGAGGAPLAGLDPGVRLSILLGGAALLMIAGIAVLVWPRRAGRKR